MGYTANRVEETSNSVGVSAFLLQGAAEGDQPFADVFAVGEVVGYCIERGAQWEVGEGELDATGQLVRSLVLASSNAGALVDFAPGTARVFCTLPAERVVAWANAQGTALRRPNGTAVTLPSGVPLSHYDPPTDDPNNVLVAFAPTDVVVTRSVRITRVFVAGTYFYDVDLNAAGEPVRVTAWAPLV